MKRPGSLIPLLALVLSAALQFGFAPGVQAQEKDALRATLLESKEKGRGVTLLVQGTAITMVVTGIEEPYVVGRSQQSSRIVVRLDRIDGVSSTF